MKQQQAKVYYETGNNFLRNRNYPRAISCYQDAIRLYPRYLKAYNNMGVAFKNAGLLKQAEETFAKALGIWPKSAVMMNNLGNVYTLMKRLDEARVLYERAIAIYPDYKEAVYNLGQIYYFTGDTKKAIDLRIRLEKLRAQKVILTPRLAALSRIRSKKRVVN